MSKGMTTCKVCGRDFALIKEEHYVASDNAKTGVMGAIGGTEPNIYDVFDCPHCGCQNIMQTRKRPHFPNVLSVGEGETEEETWACSDCKYENLDADEEPCDSCKHKYTSHYEKKED